MTRKHNYTDDTSTTCRARGSHYDADNLVEYLLSNGGSTNETAATICENLGWWRRTGSSSRELDMGRFNRARNHVKDGTRDGEPCTGYRIHYRTSGPANDWMLVDPKGGISHHRDVARAEILGDLQLMVGARTINGRRVDTAHKMADFCLAAGDTYGYQLMTEYAMELDRYGSASNTTIAQLMAYFA